MSNESPHNHSRLKEGLQKIKEKAGSFKEKVETLKTPEGREAFVKEHTDDLKSLLDQAREIGATGGEEARKAISLALKELLKYVGEIIHADLISEEFDIGLTQLLDELSGRPKISKEDFLKTLKENPEGISELLGLKKLSPEQNYRIAQVTTMGTLLETIIHELEAGGKTWTMAAARRLAPGASKTLATNFKSQLKHLRGAAINRLISDPDASLKDVAPGLMNFFANPGSDTLNPFSHVLSPVNFGEIKTDDDLNRVQSEAVEALRNLRAVDKAEDAAMLVLREEIDKAKEETLSPYDKERIVLRHYQNILTNHNYYEKFMADAAEYGVTGNEAAKYIYGVAELEAQREIDQLAAYNIDPATLDPSIRPLFNQYSDMLGLNYTDLADETNQWLTEELLINGAVLLATVGTGSLASAAGRAAIAAGEVALAAQTGAEGLATGVRLSTAAIRAMEASATLSKYLPKSIRAVQGLQKLSTTPAAKMLVTSTVDKFYEENVRMFRNTEEFSQVLAAAPNWVPGILINIVSAKGADKILGLKMAQTTSRVALDRFAGRIGNIAVRQIAREIITKQPAEVSLKYLLAAVQNGATDATMEEFTEEFGDSAYELYLSSPA